MERIDDGKTEGHFIDENRLFAHFRLFVGEKGKMESKLFNCGRKRTVPVRRAINKVKVPEQSGIF